jgi:hypothetical protein
MPKIFPHAHCELAITTMSYLDQSRKTDAKKFEAYTMESYSCT